MKEANRVERRNTSTVPTNPCRGRQAISVLGAAVALLAACAVSQAAFVSGIISVNVDPISGPHSYTGAALIGSSGGQWNDVTATNQSLTDTTGGTTGVQLTYPATNGNYGGATGTSYDALLRG